MLYVYSTSSSLYESGKNREELLSALQTLLMQIGKGELPSEEHERKNALHLLSAFECWEEFIALTTHFIKDSFQEEVPFYYQALASVYLNYYQDADACARMLCEAASTLKMSFKHFWRVMISEVVVDKDYRLEAEIIEKVVAVYRRSDFLEHALEHLVLLYEEKLFIESKICDLYRQLLTVNPNNHKALLHSKIMYAQSQNWVKVVQTLKSLMVSSQGTGEEAYYRIELATVYIHNMNETDAALKILDPIDASCGLQACQVKFSLLFLMGEFELALEALQPLRMMVDKPPLLAAVYYHMAVTQYNLGNKKDAFKHFEQSLKKHFSPFVLKRYAKVALSYGDKKSLSSILHYISQRAGASHKYRDQVTKIRAKYFVQ